MGKTPALMGVATFRELYRSRDGRITVFEDAQGHITSVKSSRLVRPEPCDDVGGSRVGGCSVAGKDAAAT